jgi:hypothetical protein
MRSKSNDDEINAKGEYSLKFAPVTLRQEVINKQSYPGEVVNNNNTG